MKIKLLLVCLVLAGFHRSAVAAAYKVYAGGVAGIEDLTEPANSQHFRAAGGGLYLHNSGWGKLKAAEREQVIRIFKGAPVGIELGFGIGPAANAWAATCKHHYLDLGLRPDFIAANAFANDNHPTVAQWAAFMKSLRAAGVPQTTLILPTFEYQNFRSNIPTLAQNLVSQSAWFQGILKQAGGIALDTPCGYFFGREEAYRAWVIDALRWARGQGLKSVVIMSPHDSKTKFAEHSRRYLEYLEQHGAMPDIIVCENYNPKASADYPNRVGSETKPNTTLGIAWMLEKASGPK